MEQKVDLLLLLQKIIVNYGVDNISDVKKFTKYCRQSGYCSHNDDDIVHRMISLLYSKQDVIDLKYLIKFNYSWVKMNLSQWISHCNHPCPIITLAKNKVYGNKYVRINNYQDMNLIKFGNKIDYISIPHNFCQFTSKCIESANTGYMAFQKKIDMHILGMLDNNLDCYYSSKQISLNDLLNQNKQIKKFSKYPVYLLQYIDHKEIPNLNLLLQYSPITKRYIDYDTPNEVTGHKIKIQIIKKQEHWKKYETKNHPEMQIWYYKLSKFLTDYVINEKEIIIGHFHYHYKYQVKEICDKSDSTIHHFYIDYLSSKPLESIKQYYQSESFENIQILHQYFNNRTNLSGDLNCVSNYQWTISHKFWIGISIHYELFDVDIKQFIYNKIQNWKQNCPQGITCDESDNRLKYFIGYRYFYRTKYMTTTDVNRASAIAGGVRNIPNAFIPQWLIKLINYLKKKGFINQNENINQIGINHYYNNAQTKNVYSGIEPHKEAEKFSVVYSVSIYGNTHSPTSLSFNLHSNKSNGDAKILMPDRCGLHLQGFFSYIYRYMFYTFCVYIFSTKLEYEYCDTFCVFF